MPGTTDGDAPENYTAEQLSRVKDAYEQCQHVDTQCNTRTAHAFWKSLPHSMRIEYNFAKWKYVAEQ